jgi:hypothetical protein
VFKMKIGEPVDVQFNVFTRSIFKVSPDWSIVPEMVIQKAVFKMKIAS